MFINPISSSTNFDGRARLRLKDNSTAVIDVFNNSRNSIKKVSCNVWYKGKVLQQVEYKWKNGICYDHFLETDTTSDLSKKLKLDGEEGEMKVADTIFNAYLNELTGESD